MSSVGYLVFVVSNFSLVYILLCKFEKNSWNLKDLKKFILNIFHIPFSDDIRKLMKTKYLNNPDYNFEKVNRASLACGPMVKWAIAQVLAFKFYTG